MNFKGMERQLEIVKSEKISLNNQIVQLKKTNEDLSGNLPMEKKNMKNYFN